MKETTAPEKKPLRLFLIAAFVTFGFITALQFTPVPWFFLALIAMHGGIAMFIISKRTFKKLELDVKQFFRLQYTLLIPYLLVMVYTFTSRAGIIPMFTDAKTALVLLYSAFCFFATFWNYLRLKRSLTDQLDSKLPHCAEALD